MIQPLLLPLALAGWLIFADKLVSLRRWPGDRVLRILCATVASFATCITVYALRPALQRFSAVAGLDHLLADCATLVWACLAQVFLFRLTSTGEDTRTRVVVRCHYVALAGVLALAVTIFAASPGAGSPYGHVYLAYLALALVNIARLLLRYIRGASGPMLRAGAIIMVVACACGLLAVLVEGLSLHGWSVPGTGGEVPGPGTFLVSGWVVMTAGGTVYSWGAWLSAPWRWLERYRAHRRIHPLWEAVCRAAPEIALVPPEPSRVFPWFPRRLRFVLYRKVVEIRDGQLTLRPYAHPQVAAVAREISERAGLSDAELRASVEAAHLASAIAAVRAGGPAGEATAVPEPGGTGGGDLDTEVRWLARVADAYQHGPVVATALERVGLTERAGTPEGRT